MKQLQAFLMANKVFLTGLAASIVVTLHQFISHPTVDWKVVSYAVMMAVCSYVANQWRGQGMTMCGVVGTLAYNFVTVHENGSFTWSQFIMTSLATVLAMAAPPPKSADYEKTNVISNAKQGFSNTAKIDGIDSKPASDGKQNSI